MTSVPRPLVLWVSFTLVPRAARNSCSSAASWAFSPLRPTRLAVAADHRKRFGVGPGDHLLHLPLGLADAQTLLLNPLGEGVLLALVAQRQQRPGVALADLARANGRLDRLGQFQQPDQVGDRRAVDLQPPGQIPPGCSRAFSGTAGTRRPSPTR